MPLGAQGKMPAARARFIGDTRGLVNAVSRSKKSIRSFSATMQTAGTALRSFGWQLGIITGAITAVVARPLKKAIKTFKDVQSELSMARLIAGETKETWQAVADTVADLGQRSKFTTIQIANVTRVLASAGYESKKIIQLLGPINDLAIALGSNLPQAAALTRSSVEVLRVEMGKAASDMEVATRAVDAMSRAQRAFSIEADDLKFFTEQLSGSIVGANLNFEKTLAVYGAVNQVMGNGARTATGLSKAIDLLQRRFGDVSQAKVAERMVKFNGAARNAKKEISMLNRRLKLMKVRGKENTQQYARLEEKLVKLKLHFQSLTNKMKDNRSAFVRDKKAIEAVTRQLHAHGMTIKDIQGTDIAKIFRNLEKAGIGAAAAQRIMGREGAKIYQVFKKLPDIYDKGAAKMGLMADKTKTTATAAEIAEEKLKDLDEQITLLTSSMDEMHRMLGEKLEPILLPFVKKMKKIVDQVTDWISVHEKLIQTIVVKGAKILAIMSGIAAASVIIGAALHAMGSVLKWVILLLGKKLIFAMLGAIPKLALLVAGIIAFGGSLKKLFAKESPLVRIFKIIVKVLRIMLNSFIAVFSLLFGLIKGVVSAFSGLDFSSVIDSTEEWIDKIYELMDIVAKLAPEIAKLGEIVGKTFAESGDRAKLFFSSLMGMFVSYLDACGKVLSTWIGKMVQFVYENTAVRLGLMILAFMNRVEYFIVWLMSGLGYVVFAFRTMGLLLKGIFYGVANVVAKIFDKLFGSILDSIRNLIMSLRLIAAVSGNKWIVKGLGVAQKFIDAIPNAIAKVEVGFEDVKKSIKDIWLKEAPTFARETGRALDYVDGKAKKLAKAWQDIPGFMERVNEAVDETSKIMGEWFAEWDKFASDMVEALETPELMAQIALIEKRFRQLRGEAEKAKDTIAELKVPKTEKEKDAQLSKVLLALEHNLNKELGIQGERLQDVNKRMRARLDYLHEMHRAGKLSLAQLREEMSRVDEQGKNYRALVRERNEIKKAISTETSAFDESRQAIQNYQKALKEGKGVEFIKKEKEELQALIDRYLRMDKAADKLKKKQSASAKTQRKAADAVGEQVTKQEQLINTLEELTGKEGARLAKQWDDIKAMKEEITGTTEEVGAALRKLPFISAQVGSDIFRELLDSSKQSSEDYISWLEKLGEEMRQALAGRLAAGEPLEGVEGKDVQNAGKRFLTEFAEDPEGASKKFESHKQRVKELKEDLELAGEEAPEWKQENLAFMEKVVALEERLLKMIEVRHGIISNTAIVRDAMRASGLAMMEGMAEGVREGGKGVLDEARRISKQMKKILAEGKTSPGYVETFRSRMDEMKQIANKASFDLGAVLPKILRPAQVSTPVPTNEPRSNVSNVTDNRQLQMNLVGVSATEVERRVSRSFYRRSNVGG